MKLLALTALCALAVAHIPDPNWLDELIPEFGTQSGKQEDVFRAQREYKYVYNGQILTGIPSSSEQHSGIRIQALVSVVFKTQRTAVMKITNIRMGKLNRHVLEPKSILSFMAFENAPINSDLQQKLESPVKFNYDRGLVTNIQFDENEETWSADIKRGIMNILQVNIQKKNEIKNSGETLTTNERVQDQQQQNEHYRTLETFIDGTCETVYTVLKQQNPWGNTMNVTASVDFDKCQQRPSIKYNFRFQDPCQKCPSCPICESKHSDDKFMKSSSVYRFNISGTQDSFLIEKSNVESQYVVVPFNEEGNVISTYVNQQLTLVKSGPVETDVDDPQNPTQYQSLIYQPTWDIMKEKFYMEGDEEFHQQNPFAQIRNKVESASLTIRKLVSELKEQVEDHAPQVFENLIQFIRMSKRQELEKIWKKFVVDVPEDYTPEEHKKIRSLLVDALVAAGTKDSIGTFVDKVKRRQISPSKANFALKSLINVRTVSQDMIQELQSLAEHEVCQRNYFLKQSTYLTMGSMMNALCSPNEDKLASEFEVEDTQRRFCPRELKQKYVQTLVTKLDNADSWEEKLMYIRTIGNAGLDLSADELEKIIKNQKSGEKISTSIRVEAVAALRQIGDYMPQKVQKILMPVFMNKRESPELRIAAASVILKTYPDQSVLDQMARQQAQEHNRQVASLIYSYMSSLANSTVPCEKKVAEGLKLALRRARFVPTSVFNGLSKVHMLRSYDQKYKFGLGASLKQIYSDEGEWPIYGSVKLSPNVGGFWMRKLLKLSYGQKGMDKLYKKYLGGQDSSFQSEIEQFLNRSPRSTRTRNPLQELESRFKQLNILSRTSLSEGTPKATLSLKVKDQDVGFLPYSFENLSEQLEQIIQSDSLSIGRMLQSGKNIHVTKGLQLHEMSLQIPTTLGFPLKVRISMPTVISVTGHVKAELNSNNVPYSVKLIAQDLKPSAVITAKSEVEIWTPVVNSGLKVLGKAKVFVPITGEIELNLGETTELKVKVDNQQRSVKLLTVETRPSTFTRNWSEYVRTLEDPEEKTIMGEQWQRVTNIDKEFGEDLLGVKYTVKGQWHKTPSVKVSDTPFCPLSGPNKLVVKSQPGSQMPTEYVFKLTGQLNQNDQEEMKPELREFSQFSQGRDSWESRLYDTSSEEQESGEQGNEEESLQWNKLRSYQSNKQKKHSLSMELYSNGGQSPKKFTLKSVARCNSGLRFCKFGVEMENKLSSSSQNQQTPRKVCLEGETLFPTTPWKFNDLKGQKALGQLKASWGDSCQSDSYVRINVVGQRSNEQIQQERLSHEYQVLSQISDKDKLLQSPVYQYQYVKKFAHLLEYKMQVDFNQLSVDTQETFNSVFRYIKHKLYSQTQVQQVKVRNEPNRIRATLRINPLTKQYADLFVKSPSENTKITDIPIPGPVSVGPVNTRDSNPFMSIFRSSDSRGLCQVNSRHVTTFDQVNYQVPFSTCETVLVKDCSTEPRYGVYMKKMSQDSDQKTVRILTREDEIELIPESDSYDSVKVKINGQQKQSPENVQPVMHHGQKVVLVKKTGDYVTVKLPKEGVKIYFDGYSTNIKVSQSQLRTQCGLCGHFNNEQEDEFRMPNNELTEDVREFYQSYIISKDNCQQPQISDICLTPRCEIRRKSSSYQNCAACQQAVENTKQNSNSNKQQLRQSIQKSCKQFGSRTSSCLTKLEQKVNKIWQKIQEGESTEQTCYSVGGCTRHSHSNQIDELLDLDDQQSNQISDDQENQQSTRQQRWWQQGRKQQRTMSPILRTKVLEQGHQLCFSKQPVPVCQKNSYPKLYREQQRVVYSCVNRDDWEATVYQRRASTRNEVISEIQGLPASFTNTEVIPESCSTFY